MMIVTAMSLAYIHMQMQIYALGYQRIVQEKQVQKLVENNGNVTHTILTLSSADHLGKSVLEKNTQMQFMDSRDIVAIKAPQPYVQEKKIAQEEKLKKAFNPLLSLLSWGTEAQAKTTKE